MSENQHAQFNGQGKADPKLNAAQFTIRRHPKTTDLHYKSPGKKVEAVKTITVTHTRQGLKGGKWVSRPTPKQRKAGKKD